VTQSAAGISGGSGSGNNRVADGAGENQSERGSVKVHEGER